MKRVLTFVIALAFSVGASAPAVFATDLPSIPVPEDNISIWDTGSTSVNDPYNAEDLFEYSNNFWGDLFDDGRFNNVTVSDNQRYLVELAVSKYVSTHPDEEVNGVMTSYFDDIVNHVIANPSDFDIYWTPDGFVSALTGDPYMNLQFGVDFYDNLYDYVIANYYSIPSGGAGTVVQFGSGSFLFCPVGITNARGTVNGGYTVRNDVTVVDCYIGFYTNGSHENAVVCSYNSGGHFKVIWGYISNGNWRGQGTFLDGNVSTSYTGSETSGYYFNNGSWSSSFTSSVYGVTPYASLSDALTAFFGIVPSGNEPVSDGKVYIREEPIGGNSLTVSYPALPVSNSKSVSNYYYETYGDTFENSESVIDNRVFNNNTTTVYPVTYDNNIPLWLITSSIDVSTFDYSLELPSVDLQELPNEFEGGGDFFQDSFLALGGFGSFVLIAFSFGLVALFFKG